MDLALAAIGGWRKSVRAQPRILTAKVCQMLVEQFPYLIREKSSETAPACLPAEKTSARRQKPREPSWRCVAQEFRQVQPNIRSYMLDQA
jgi:hypothetical protein